MGSDAEDFIIVDEEEHGPKADQIGEEGFIIVDREQEPKSDQSSEEEESETEPEQEPEDQIGAESDFTGFFYQSKTYYVDRGDHWSWNNLKDEYHSNPPLFAPIGPGLSVPDPGLTFLKHKNVSSQIQVIDSCNGLLLCTGSKKGKGFLKTWFVCNPKTMQQIALPYPDKLSSPAVYALMADLNDCGVFEFKVLCVFKLDKGVLGSKLSILSSETGEWEEFQAPLPAVSDNALLGSKVFFKNKLLWDCLDGKILISYLDSGDRDCPFELIDSPEAPLGRFLWRSEDKIRCYCYGFADKYPAWSIQLDDHKKKPKWVLENCEEFKNLSEDVCRWLTLKEDTPFRFRILAHGTKSNKFFLFFAGSIYSYGLRNRNLEAIWAHPTPHQSKFYSGIRIIPYVGSLALIQKWRCDANSVQEDPLGDILESVENIMESAANNIKPRKNRRKMKNPERAVER